jgi:hypothetical protein
MAMMAALAATALGWQLQRRHEGSSCSGDMGAAVAAAVSATVGI